MRDGFLFDRVNAEPCREPESPYALHQREVAAEAERLDDAKHRILARLREGPATNLELNAICFRYGARIFELKRAGHPIEKTHEAGGVWIYRLEEGHGDEDARRQTTGGGMG